MNRAHRGEVIRAGKQGGERPRGVCVCVSGTERKVRERVVPNSPCLLHMPYSLAVGFGTNSLTISF